MKEFLLSAFIVISFIAYSFIQKFGVEIPTSTTSPETESNNTQTVVSTPVVSSPTPTKPSVPTATSEVPTSVPPIPKTSNKYKDGAYTGDIIDAQYGNVQVKVIISNGKIIDVQFLDYPHDRSTSQRINSRATPMLTSEAIAAQSANVDAITGASFTSAAFVESLQSALNKAVNS